MVAELNAKSIREGRRVLLDEMILRLPDRVGEYFTEVKKQPGEIVGQGIPGTGELDPLIFEYAAFAHDDHPSAQGQGFLDMVCNEEDGEAPLPPEIQ